jgi:hypothetical protein
MGRKNRLSFTVNNVIFYECQAELRARSKPGKVRQTKATKRSAGHFGEAVFISKCLRDGLYQLLRGQKQNEIMLRLNNALFKWILAGKSIHDIGEIRDFQFNTKTGIRERLKWPLQVNWTASHMQIPIPAIIPSEKIVAAAYTREVEWKVVVTGCHLKTGHITYSPVITLTIPYQDVELPAQEITIPFVAEPGSINIVVASMRSLVLLRGELREHKNLRWQPMDIVDVILR